MQKLSQMRQHVRLIALVQKKLASMSTLFIIPHSAGQLRHMSSILKSTIIWPQLCHQSKSRFILCGFPAILTKWIWFDHGKWWIYIPLKWLGWLSDWLVDLLISWLIVWLIDWLIDWSNDWSSKWLVDQRVVQMIDWLFAWSIDWLIDSSIQSLIVSDVIPVFMVLYV